MSHSINEQTRYALTLLFTDETGSPVTPSSVNYTLISADNGTVIIPETPLVVTGSSHILIIPATANVLLDNDKTSELRRVIITAPGLAKIKYEYWVVRV